MGFVQIKLLSVLLISKRFLPYKHNMAHIQNRIIYQWQSCTSSWTPRNPSPTVYSCKRRPYFQGIRIRPPSEPSGPFSRILHMSIRCTYCGDGPSLAKAAPAGTFEHLVFWTLKSTSLLPCLYIFCLVRTLVFETGEMLIVPFSFAYQCVHFFFFLFWRHLD